MITHVHGPEMALMHLIRRLLLTCMFLTASWPAQSQFRVDVSGIGLQQIPLASVVFKDEVKTPQPVSDIIRADLERSGLFRNIKLSDSMDENTKPDLNGIKSRGADAALAGSVTRLADGRYDIRYRLWDAIKAQDLGGASFLVVAADLRLAAHRIADQIYEKLTGEKGVFSTRLAYVTKRGSGFTLWIADADGENAQPALNSPEPIISPSWSPNGKELAYVSFETRKPVVYVHDVSTGKRRVLANFKGSNSAPAWSPDGRSLAVTLSRDGGSQIYLIPATGGEPQRLTQSNSIDTEPAFSPDGSAIYFVSDRGGSPQIYRTPARGGPVQRVTFAGNYNISPHLSPDGRWLTYVSRVGGQFKVHLMDLQSEQVTQVTPTTFDERPSFAPNSRLIVYATQVQGREALMTTTLDGKITARLAGQSGDIREPHWGPFQP
jgi:TolB protein